MIIARRRRLQRRRPAHVTPAAVAALNPLADDGGHGGALGAEENPLAAAGAPGLHGPPAATATPRAAPAPLLARTTSVASLATSSARAEALAAAEANLAPGWTPKWSNSRAVCYWVAEDGQSVWEKPVAKLGDTLALTDLELIRNEDVKSAVALRRAASGRAVYAEAPAPAPALATADDPGDAAMDLAPGWAPVWSRSREQWYWRNKDKNETTWEKPVKLALPPGWIEQWSKSRERKYYKHVDGRTSWEVPQA